MGTYLNPRYDNFKKTLAGEIYVDKTAMISVMNKFIDKGNTYVCISRPRRFGKTVAGNMLVAYYSKGCDSNSLFCADFEEKLNKYNELKHGKCAGTD